jgi:hypothetical protein
MEDQKIMLPQDDPKPEGDMPKPDAMPGGDMPKPDAMPGSDMPKPDAFPGSDPGGGVDAPREPDDPGGRM